MAAMMTLKEASEYLKLSENQVRVLLEAHELRGRQEGEEWQIDRVSAYTATQITWRLWPGPVSLPNPLKPTWKPFAMGCLLTAASPSAWNDS